MDGSSLELGELVGDAISRIRFAPRSNNLLISSWDSVLRLYDVDGCVLRLRASSDGALLDCCFENERTALSVSSDGCIRRYDFSSEIQSVVGKHDDSIICIDHSEETGQFISAGLDKKLKFWDMKIKNGDAGCMKVVDSNIWSMSLCHHYLLTAVGNLINIYDLRNLKGPVQIKDSSMNHQLRCVRSFSNCEGYAIGSVDGCVAVEYLYPSKLCEKSSCVFRCHPKSISGRYHLAAINDIGIHPGSNTFVTGDNTGYTIMWDLQSKKKLFELQRYPCGVSSLSYNHTGQLLAVSSSYTYQEAHEIKGAPQIYIHSMVDIAKPSPSS